MIVLIISLILLGLALYLIESLFPNMNPAILVCIRVVIVLFAFILILRAFGVVDIPVPK